ncbi:hypothetical protein AHF37_09139 [Paragonimus kellicotti]|nr:hypothetical protein AHF37_09139 [Paragonimus kellicotti]
MVSYTRYATQNDTGDLILQAKLEREIYYHGQEIKVKIQIENNSSRHVVDTVAVFVEQTYRLFHQFPHDSSIPLGEVLLKSVIIQEPDEPTDGKTSPKGSPKGKKSSPKDKSPQKGKKSPRDKSPGKGAKAPPIPIEEPAQTETKPTMTIKEINILTNKQACRSATVAYDVVVRLNLRLANGEESGHPMVRLPFILTRETRFLDKLANPPPPTWAVVQPH